MATNVNGREGFQSIVYICSQKFTSNLEEPAELVLLLDKNLEVLINNGHSQQNSRA